MAFPTLPAPGQPLLPPPPPRLQQTPSELVLPMFEFASWRECCRHSSVIDPVTVVFGLHPRLDAALRELTPASRTMQALDAARDIADFAAALDRIDQVALQYRDRCREAAWSAFVQQSVGAHQARREAWLACLLERRLPLARGRAPLWDRAARFLLQHRQTDPPPRRAPSPWCVRLVLETAAAEPALTPAAWRRLLQLAGEAGRYRGLDPAFFEVPGLDAQQRLDLAAMHACVAIEGQDIGLPALQALIARIEDTVSPACRWPVLSMLRDCLRLDEGGAPVRQPLVEALLRVRPADLEAAIKAMPAVGTDAQWREFLLKESARLPPASALRALARHASHFNRPPAARELLLTRCRQLLADAQAQPAGCRDAVDAISMMTQWVYEPLESELQALALQACTALPRLWTLLPALGRLRPGTLPPGAWEQAWEQALNSAPGGTAPLAARQRIRALLPGLPCRAGRDSLRPLLDATLRCLAPDDLALALVEMAGILGHPGRVCMQADARLVLALCGELPFYLRERPLAAWRALGSALPAGAAERLDTLLATTTGEREAWTAALPRAAPAAS